MSYNRLLKRFVGADSGAAAIEYALLVALLAVAIIGATRTLGMETSDSFQSFTDTLEEARS